MIRIDSLKMYVIIIRDKSKIIFTLFFQNVNYNFCLCLCIVTADFNDVAIARVVRAGVTPHPWICALSVPQQGLFLNNTLV